MDNSNAADANAAARQDGTRPLLEIDAQTCVACGLCVRACPVFYLTQTAPKTRPECVPDGRCLHCGHCVAVCPRGAIIHTRMDQGAFETLKYDWDAEAVETLLRAKRTVRRFKDKPVSREMLERLLDTAVCAPSNSNSQDRAFLVLTDRGFINALEAFIIDTFRTWMEAELRRGGDPTSYMLNAAQKFIKAQEEGHHPVFHDAPCVVCVHTHAVNHFGAYNCIVAMDYLMLHAHALGLGSCIVGAAIHTPEKTGRFLGLADDRALQSVIALGYPDMRFKRTVSRRPPQISWHSDQNTDSACSD